MAYPAPFHRLVLIGTQYADTWNTTLTIAPKAGTGSLSLGTVSPTDLAAIAAVVGAWFPLAPSSTAPGFLAQAKLTGIKLNRIGTDGRYTDPDSMEHTYPSPITGGGGGTTFLPAQVAVVSTLETAVPRGQASKGRMFWPSIAWVSGAQLGSDGRMTSGNAAQFAGAVATLVSNINDAYVGIQSGDEMLGVASVGSTTGSGLFREITSVRVGRVPDTVRSRRSKLAEDYQSAALP